MKIMFIIHSLDKVGGAETVLVKLLNYFSSQLHYEVVLTLLSDKKIVFNLNSNIKVIQYKSTSDSNGLKKIIQQIKAIRVIFLENKPEVIISFVTGTNILATIAAKFSHIPIIISERSSYAYGVRNKFWSLLRRYVYPFANVLVLPTKEEEKKYFYVKKIKQIPNPIQMKRNHEDVHKENIFLAVGTLHWVKGFDMLIDAFAQLDVKNWKLIILGEGILRDELNQQIEKLNLSDSISLLGHQDDTELFYRKASVFILSSRSEGYPNVLCEAMSYGCSSIAFDCKTGPKEIITDKKDGLLISENNIKELSQAMNNLINNEKYRRKLSKEAEKISQRLNIDTIAKKWESLIHEIARRKGELAE